MKSPSTSSGRTEIFLSAHPEPGEGFQLWSRDISRTTSDYALRKSAQRMMLMISLQNRQKQEVFAEPIGKYLRRFCKEIISISCNNSRSEERRVGKKGSMRGEIVK